MTVDDDAQVRPAPTAELSAAEFVRWYWLKTELVELAHQIGISPTGSKMQLTERIAAALDGRTPPPAPTRPRTIGGTQLTGVLTLNTVIPFGQRSSQALRAFFQAHLGPGFRFDHRMREFITTGAGKTLGEAISHWENRPRTPTETIAPQFELNRFTRQWHLDHPGGNRADLLTAWRAYRSLPADRRS